MPPILSEPLVWVGGAVALAAGTLLSFFAAMAKFLHRPSPSEAIIRIGRAETHVYIGRAAWIVPVLHRAATMSLSTIGLTIRRVSHDALVSKDFIPTNLSAEFYIRVEPNEDDVKKASRTLGIEEGSATTDAIRVRAQKLLEPKLVGALRAVAAQSDFLALHLNRDHFAQEVSKALREDLGRNGFTLESVTITELAQTPLSEMRADDIFGSSGRETVTNTVVQRNIAVKRKQQEEAERIAEIDKEQEIKVAQQSRLLREGKAKEEEAAKKAEIAKEEAIEARDLQRQANISVERNRKEQTELAAGIAKQKVAEAAKVDKEKTIEAAQFDKQITLTLKAKEAAEADAQKAAALSLLEKANQEVVTVQHVADAERQKRVAVVHAEQEAEKQRIAADMEAYKKRVEADAQASALRAAAEGRAQAVRMDAEGAAEAVKIKAQAEAQSAELQATALTKLAEARREAGLKEAQAEGAKIAARNSQSAQLMFADLAAAFIQKSPEIVRELVKPAEKITEMRVLNVQGLSGMTGTQTDSQGTALGQALGPVARTILESSAILPLAKELGRFAEQAGIRQALVGAVPALEKPLEILMPAAQSVIANPQRAPEAPAAAPAAPAGKVAGRRPPAAPTE
jgi:flotillin